MGLTAFWARQIISLFRSFFKFFFQKKKKNMIIWTIAEIKPSPSICDEQKWVSSGFWARQDWGPPPPPPPPSNTPMLLVRWRIKMREWVRVRALVSLYVTLFELIQLVRNRFYSRAQLCSAVKTEEDEMNRQWEVRSHFESDMGMYVTSVKYLSSQTMLIQFKAAPRRINMVCNDK